MGWDSPRGVNGQMFDRRTLLMISLIYVSIFVLIVFLMVEILSIRDAPMLLVSLIVPLIPFLIMMASYGQVRKLAAGSGSLNFEIVFTEAVTGQIQPISFEDELKDYKTFENVVEKREVDSDKVMKEVLIGGGIIDPDRIQDKQFLSFQLGELVEYDVVGKIVEHMPRLSYVFFIDPDGKFKGLISGLDFRSVYWNNPEDFANRILTESVLNTPGVVTESVTPDITKDEALAKMTEDDVDKLGVVDSDGWPVGVITQDEISRGILLQIISQIKSQLTES